MKKTIAILLVAILAVSSVFAAFSGEAKIGFGADLDNGKFGFMDKGANVKFDIDLATANAESVGDGDVYASIKATFGLKLTTGEKKYGEGDPFGGIVFNDQPGEGKMGSGKYGLAIIADITEAKIGGENWYVSILGVPDAPNFAESAIDTYTVKGAYDKYGLARDDYDKAYNYGVAFEKADGVEVGVYDYVFGVGFVNDYDDDDNWKFEDKMGLSLYAKTPEYDFSGLTLQAGAVYSYKGKTLAAAVEPKNAIGVSAKVGFANDTLSASIATDMGFNLEEKKAKDVFDMDLAANFGWSFLTLDAYYATEAKTAEKWIGTTADWDKTEATVSPDILSFQAKFDLNTFDVPVAITASVKDVLKTVELGVKAEVTAVENLKITANAGYVVNTVDAYDKDFNKENKDVFLGQWKFGADVEYDFGFAKLAAGVDMKNVGYSKVDSATPTTFDKHVMEDYEKKEAAGDFKTSADGLNYLVNQVILGASASITTSSIIPGAELKLAWENGDDLLNIFQYNAADDVYNFGKITASCKIAF